MSDTLTSAQRSLRMANIRRRNTTPELTVRRLVHGLGFRFRTCIPSLPGSPDLVLRRWNCAIFVHGCFWHGHSCYLFRLPSTRSQWWAEKIAANRARDATKEAELLASGWRVITVWQCALSGRDKLSAEALSSKLNRFIRAKSTRAEVRGRPKAIPVRKSPQRRTAFRQRRG